MTLTIKKHPSSNPSKHPTNKFSRKLKDYNSQQSKKYLIKMDSYKMMTILNANIVTLFQERIKPA
jgi:hypothetical protein